MEWRALGLDPQALVACVVSRVRDSAAAEAQMRARLELPPGLKGFATNLILFADEAHMLVGAGSALGAPADAANMFKSVLARGTVRMIGATTLSEYTMHIQDGEALARRFRVVLWAGR